MSKTIAESFRNDPRVAEARRLLTAALNDHRQRIQEPTSSHDDLAQAYAKDLDRFASLRGGPLYYPYIGSGIGNGALVELGDGSIKYDMITGIGVHGMGHSHPALLNAGMDAALEDTVMQGNLQQSGTSMTLASQFLGAANRHAHCMDHCFLTTSGAMANENALKIAFNHRQHATRLLAFERCFAGRTLALSHMTDKAAYRVGIPTTIHVDHVPFYDATNPAGSTDRAVAALNRHIHRHPDMHAVMTLELIQGEGGYYPGSQSFFEAIMEVLKEHNILVHVDEIQSFGRTSRPFAYQYFNLSDHVDLVSVGKISQVCATLFRKQLKPMPGIISQTFTGSSSSIHAAIAILNELLHGDYLGDEGRINKIHERFATRFEQLATKYPDRFRGPFGLGTMIACTVYDGDPTKTKAFARSLFDAGVIGFIAGAGPMRMRFLPPFAATTDEDIDAVCEIIERVLAGGN